MARVGAMVVRDIPPDEVTRHVARLVDHLDELWVVEDLGWAGGVAQAATLLERFPDVTVGHGIAPAPFRHPAARWSGPPSPLVIPARSTVGSGTECRHGWHNSVWASHRR